MLLFVTLDINQKYKTRTCLLFHYVHVCASEDIILYIFLVESF